jgi:hypothetical protein
MIVVKTYSIWVTFTPIPSLHCRKPGNYTSAIILEIDVMKKSRLLKITFLPLSKLNFLVQSRGVFRNFELRVLTVINCPKIVGAKGR